MVLNIIHFSINHELISFIYIDFIISKMKFKFHIVNIIVRKIDFVYIYIYIYDHYYYFKRQHYASKEHNMIG